MRDVYVKEVERRNWTPPESIEGVKKEDQVLKEIEDLQRQLIHIKNKLNKRS